MARRKVTAAEYIHEQTLVPFGILGDLVEHLGQAAQAWSAAVQAAEAGDLDRALTYVVEFDIAIDIPLRVGRAELHRLAERAANLLDAELPDDEEPPE